MIRAALIDPNQTWALLDSFWREEVSQTTEDLVHYQMWASLLCELSIHAKAQHFLNAQTVPENETGHTQEAALNIPWVPLVLFQDRLVDQSIHQYGDGFVYGGPPLIQYGEESGTPSYRLLPSRPFREITNFTDAVTEPLVVIDQSQVSYDQQSGEVVISVDPFTLIPAKTDQTSGRLYIVLWMRNPLLDLNVPFDWTGWVVKYDRETLDKYAETLKYIWELVLLGPSIGRYKQGLMTAMGFPFAEQDDQIQRVDTDGYQLLISTDATVYKAVDADVSAVVSPGDEVREGQPLTDGVTFLEYPDTTTASFSVLPGLLLRVPLSTGVVAELTFANIDTQWTYDASRPSPFRFPVGGNDDLVEQFWVDVDTFATANSIDFQTLYGLSIPGTPGPTGDAVNPMDRIITDLLHNSLFVASVQLSDMPLDPGSFHDRARLLLPQDTLFVLQQLVDDQADVYDLGTETSDSVEYGYNTTITTEVISVPGSGTDLTYFDYTPLVVIS